MNRNTCTISIAADEWRNVAFAVEAIDPWETSLDHGVAMVVDGDHRWWLVWKNDLVVSEGPYAHRDEIVGSIVVPPRLVLGAARLVDDPSSDVGDDLPLSVGDDRMSVVADEVQLSFAIPATRLLPPPRPDVPELARATTQVRNVWHMLESASILPTGVDGAHGEVPPFEVEIESCTLSFAADWTARGALRTEVSALVDATGAAAAVVRPTALRSVLAGLADDDEVTITILDGSREVWVDTPLLQARLAAHPVGVTPPTDDEWQLQLFDPEEFAGVWVDPFAGWSLTDMRALAIDLDVDVRVAATQSRWNWDVRMQQLFATDPDERVVLAFLSEVDPGLEACELIIAGPHVGARRDLARRNLMSSLLERLASDDDPIARESALETLHRRGVRPATTGSVAA